MRRAIGPHKLLDVSSLQALKDFWLMSVLNTSVSGMLGDSNWLSTIAQNVANANTTGYKNTGTNFLSLVESAGDTPQLAGVATNTVSYNGLQGQLASTQTSTNLAVQGAGFFIVSDTSGNVYLSRNGSFVPDSQGNLVNSAGYFLMAVPTTPATASSQTVNSISGLQKVNVDGQAASAAASTAASLTLNLNSSAAVVSDLPSNNDANSTYTSETSITAYDDLGGAHDLDLYFSNEGGGNWEVDAFDHSTASANGGFPYSSGPLATGTMTFNTSTGNLTSGSTLSIPVPGGQSLTLNMANATQLDSSFAITSSTINGNAPGTVSGVSVAKNGILSFNYTNGASAAAYIVPLATVESVDNLTSVMGQAYQTNDSSGQMQINNPETAGMGAIDSSSLENSTVDLATELTNMIQAQSAYEANSKVFQTGTDLFDVLNNLKS
jgi:flagellar hook protein FlgE